MTLTRRNVLRWGGGILATFSVPSALRAAPVDVVEMRGTVRGERVWFSPQGLAVPAGTMIRFVNHDPGNSHTTTAYHPDLFGRIRRIPERAAPWDSGFLLPDESFDVTLTSPGVYDYYCQPHEMAAMVGRIVVGNPGDTGWEGPSADTDDISSDVLSALPSVEEVLAGKRIAREVEP